MPIPQQVLKITRESARERVLSQLEEWIVDGSLAPGERISDKDIAEALGVSRTPVREAMQVLEMRGLILVRPSKETIVSPVSPQQIKDLYPPMAALQALAGELAANHMSRDSLEQLRRLNEKFGEAVLDADTRTAMSLDDAFHDHIIEASNNPYVKSCIGSLHIHILRLRHLFHRQPTPALESITEHESIISALSSGNGDLAAQVIRQNWLRPMPVLLHLYGSSQG